MEALLKEKKARTRVKPKGKFKAPDKKGPVAPELALHADLAIPLRKGVLEDCIVYQGRVYRAVEVEAGSLSPNEKVSYGIFRQHTMLYPSTAVIVNSATEAKFVLMDEDAIYGSRE